MPEPAVIVGAPRVTEPRESVTAPRTSFVEWGAVWAGGAMAAALSFVLLTFGSAIGLSFASPLSSNGVSITGIASLAVFWIMAQQIGSAMVGGYIAGRMRSRWGELVEHEVEFRDGLHGGLVWAVGVIVGVALFVSTAGSVARTGTELGAGAAALAVSASPLAYQVDTLLRPGVSAAPAGGATVAASSAAAPSVPQTAVTPSPSADLRGEVLRVFSKSITDGSLAEPDKTYLGTVVAQRTGLSQQDADKRVMDTFAEANRIAKDTAYEARRVAILTGFVTAASLLVGLGAAWWGAQRGGHHRDNSIPARFTASPTRRLTA